MPFTEPCYHLCDPRIFITTTKSISHFKQMPSLSLQITAFNRLLSPPKSLRKGVCVSTLTFTNYPNNSTSFTMEVTTIHTPKPGKGNNKKRNPMGSKLRGIVKQSGITITNTDDLCCTRAIVTMKAWADEHAREMLGVSYNTL